MEARRAAGRLSLALGPLETEPGAARCPRPISGKTSGVRSGNGSGEMGWEGDLVNIPSLDLPHARDRLPGDKGPLVGVRGGALGSVARVGLWLLVVRQATDGIGSRYVLVLWRTLLA